MGASGSKAGRGHRSLNCRTATVVEFENATDRPVCTVWLGYNGTARRYFTLQPGQRVRQPTFTAHPWTFGPGDDSDSSSSSSSTPLVVDDQTVFYTPPLPAGDAPLPVRARITTAVPLGWTPATHAHFPPAFRAQAAALLRCHRRLASSSGATAPGGDAVQQGCPQWLRRLGCTLSAAQAKSSCAAADVPVAGARGEARCQLGHLPKVSGEVGANKTCLRQRVLMPPSRAAQPPTTCKPSIAYLPRTLFDCASQLPTTCKSAADNPRPAHPTTPLRLPIPTCLPPGAAARGAGSSGALCFICGQAQRAA